MNAEPILGQPGASAQLRDARFFWQSHFSGDSMLPSGKTEHDGVLQGPSRLSKARTRGSPRWGSTKRLAGLSALPWHP